MPFLRHVYASTRQEEMAMVDWNEAQKEAFIQMQFEVQSQGYRQQYPTAVWQLILLENEPIGRLIVDRHDDVIKLMDIALLPEYRGQGIGTRLVRELTVEAKLKHIPIRLYVSKINHKAYRLYKRLGFTQIGETGMHIWMEWQPD